MKLTEHTTPQAKNYQCNKCKVIKCHKNMYDDRYCNDCYWGGDKPIPKDLK